jgi:hypothetical protein
VVVPAVAILVTGTDRPERNSLSTGLAEVLGCPALRAAPIVDAIDTMVGPMAPRGAVFAAADDALWATVSAIEAGVVVEGDWVAAQRADLEARLASAGNPRVVELVTSDGPAVGVGAVVTVDAAASFDIGELVQEIAAHFQ